MPRAFTAVAIVAMVGLFYTQQATSLSAGRQNPPAPQNPQLPTFRTETHFVRVDGRFTPTVVDGRAVPTKMTAGVQCRRP